MITVIENRDFVEGVFNTPEEASGYYEKHPSQNTCRIIETGITGYPVFITETGRGNFRYFGGKNELIAFMKSVNLEELPKGTTLRVDITDPKAEWVITHDPSFTVYFLAEPYLSGIVNEDGMGGIWHDHLDPGRFAWVIRTNSLKIMGMETSLLQRLLACLRLIFKK
jgi:hypothetical protein